MDETATRNLVSRVRNVLEEFGAMEVDRIALILNVRGSVLYEACGWMSRENSIVMEGHRVRLRGR